MNKAAAAALAVLVVMATVVENGESVVRAGRAMIYNKLRKDLPASQYYYYYDGDMDVKRSSQLAAKKVGKFKPLRVGRAPKPPTLDQRLKKILSCRTDPGFYALCFTRWV